MISRCSRVAAFALLVSIVAIAAIAKPAAAIDAPLKEDRIRFVVHDLVAGQITAAQLGGYLDTVHELLHKSQNTAIDVPTCTDFGTVTGGGDPPVLFTSNGGLANNLAVVDTEQELWSIIDWAATQGDRVAVFVQDIQWCGAPAPNAIGCAPTPGSAFVVALDMPLSLMPVVLAHERGHNGNLGHRSDDSCAVMAPGAVSNHGCLNQSEAETFYNQANIATADICECIDVTFMGPNQTWSLNPQGTSCDDDDVCSTASSCDVGLCEADTFADCSDGNLCTDDECDRVTGCFNPVLPDSSPCDDGNICNGVNLCLSGTCQSNPPLVCDDQLFCNGTESCDPIFGCEAGAPPLLDDSVGCTDDSCDEVEDVVVHTPNDTLCDNSLFCDGVETCDRVADCTPGTPPPLGDGVGCTDDRCDEVEDVVVHTPRASLCDDLDPCTAERCDEITGCDSDPIPGCPVPIPASSGVGRVILVSLLFALAGGGRIRDSILGLQS